jgi:hypothetical protein
LIGGSNNDERSPGTPRRIVTVEAERKRFLDKLEMTGWFGQRN